jgi:cytochrome P450
VTTSSIRIDPTPLPQLSWVDGLRVTTEVLVPLLARGLIVRRPPVVAAAERFDLDRRAVERLQAIHRRYGSGPVRLRLPGRTIAVILEPEDATRVLRDSPHPFTPASLEKQHALGQFQPEGVLVSHGKERDERRRFNEAVLDEDRPIHRQGDHMLRVVDDEVASLLERVGDTLPWEPFAATWMRGVRRIVLGDGAADDHELTDRLGDLRASANWSFLRPRRRRARRRFLTRLESHVRRAEPGSLAETMADTPAGDRTEPTQQVPQWLFAFDPAGIATFRTLALLASHPDVAARVRAEVDAWDGTSPQLLPTLRACVLESLRLWPTTPGILRDTTRHTLWRGSYLRAGSGVLIHAPYFHRDDRNLSEAHRFAPELWAQDAPRRDWPLVPFSDGPAICPGRNVVLQTTSTWVACLLRRRDVRLRTATELQPDHDLPSVLDPFGLAFELVPR